MSLHDALDADFAPAWRPNAGDKVIGELIGLSERTGEFGAYPIVTVRTDDGSELAIHCFHEVLASKLAEQRPKIGERIGVKYLGKAAPPKRYHDYKVVVDRPDGAALDWSKYGGDSPAPSSDVPSDFAQLQGSTPAGDDSIPF